VSAEANYYRIGAFIIGGIAVLFAGLITFGAGQWFKKSIYLETYIDGTVQGIEVGSAVKFRGVQIGRVSQIGFTFSEYHSNQSNDLYNYIYILMQIDKEILPGMFEKDVQPIINKNVDEGMRIRIEPQGVTGLSYLNIDFLDPKRFPPLDYDWKPEHYYIPSAPGQLTSFLDSINNIMQQVENLNLGGLGKSGSELMETLNQTLSGMQLPLLSTDTRKVLNSFEKTVQDSKFDELSRDTRRVITEIGKSNTDLKRILSNLEPATRISGDDVNATLQNLRITSDNLRALSNDARRYPAGVLFGAPPRKPKAMEIQPTGR